MYPFGPLPSFSGNKTKVIRTAEDLSQEWERIQKNIQTTESSQEEQEEQEEQQKKEGGEKKQ